MHRRSTTKTHACFSAISLSVARSFRPVSPQFVPKSSVSWLAPSNAPASSRFCPTLLSKETPQWIVILLERVAKAGPNGRRRVGQSKVTHVTSCCHRQSAAASEANIESFEAQKAQLEATNLETKKEADALADKLNGQQFVVIRSASDSRLALRLGFDP